MGAEKLLLALGYAVVERKPDGAFSAAVEQPDWFREFLPAEDLDVTELFPFLAVFVPDCEEFWAANTEGRLQSDLWEQTGLAGVTRHLRASAVSAGGQRWLLFERMEEQYAERLAIQQHAHDMELLSRQLDLATRAKSDFLATMSHEIRTPLNAILGVADLLAGTQLNSEQREFVELFQKSGENLLTLLNEILDLSKVEAGQITLESVDFELRDVLDKAAAMMAVRARAKGLDLTWSKNADVPAILKGDPHRLRQIILNLVSNAIKFTEAGKIQVQVANQGEGKLLFAVSDSGIGIPEDKRDLVFENFAQADSSTTRKYGGTGLGLGISRRLVELMGGRIWVESAVGVGSTFFFTVRLGAAAAQVQDPPHATPEPGAARVPSLQGLRVLIADDSQANVFLLRHYLKPTGCQIETAENGEIALEKFRTGLYDLVLTDVQMPVMDGYTATKQMREWEQARGRSPAPIVALTASAMEEENRSSSEGGCTALLSKPVRQQELFRILEELTDQLSCKRIVVMVDAALEEIVPWYLESRRKEMPVLFDAFARADYDAIRVVGHNLKGTGGGYGFSALSEMGESLETAAKQEDKRAVQDLLQRVDNYLARVEWRLAG